MIAVPSIPVVRRPGRCSGHLAEPVVRVARSLNVDAVAGLAPRVERRNVRSVRRGRSLSLDQQAVCGRYDISEDAVRA